MAKNSFRTLAFSGLFCALVLLFTMYIKIPLPLGAAYINAGDAAIYAFAYAVGGSYCVLGSAAASALADLMVGASVYAIPTFIIKGIIAFVAYKGFRRYKTIPSMLIIMVIAGLIMSAGYFAAELLIFDTAYAVAALPFNLIQAVGGAIVAWPMLLAIKKYVKEWN
ncbi:MAG: ECF transporter S component [Christensenellales bacterium]